MKHYLNFLVYSQNAGFGLPSSFSWLDKYRKKIAKQSPLPARKQSNDLFGMDEFDPLKYMNIDNGKAKLEDVTGKEWLRNSFINCLPNDKVLA